MISTTFQGELVYLLPYRPDWSTKPTATFSLPTIEQHSLNGSEARRPYAGKLRASFNFTAFLFANDSAQFRTALQVQENKRVLCPFWPAAAAIGTGLVYTDGSGNLYTTPNGTIYTQSGAATFFQSGIWFTFEPDMSSWEVHTVFNPVSFTPSENAIRVPLMLGYFKNPPAPKPITAKLLTVPIEFTEAGPANYALTPIAVDGAPGLPLATGITPKVFPGLPNWSTTPVAGAATVDIKREQIGFGREQAETYYPQNAARSLDLNFTKTSWETVANLVNFFAARKGTVEPFWLPGALDECDLTAPTDTASTTIHVDRAVNLGLNRFLAFIPPRSAVEIRLATTVNTGTNTLILDQAPAAIYRPSETRIASAILCRFRAPVIQLTFTTDALADATLNLIETPNEYQLQSGETTGVTTGALPAKAFLFRFIRQMPGQDIVDRFTNYETAINLAGEAFTKTKDVFLSHDQIVTSLNPEETKITPIKSAAFIGNPLLLFLPNQLEVPLLLQVLECNPDSSGYAATARVRFFGSVDQPTFDGPIITASATSILQKMNRLAPRVIKQKTCNWSIYSVPCGVAKASYTRTATIVSQTGNRLVLSGLSGAAPSLSYFRGGQLWFGTGATYQARTINDSSVIASGQITLTLNRALAPLPTGTVSLVPGCSGTTDACKAFSNYARFGGFPFTPIGNPSLIDQSQGQKTGGKK